MAKFKGNRFSEPKRSGPVLGRLSLKLDILAFNMHAPP